MNPRAHFLCLVLLKASEYFLLFPGREDFIRHPEQNLIFLLDMFF